MTTKELGAAYKGLLSRMGTADAPSPADLSAAKSALLKSMEVQHATKQDEEKKTDDLAPSGDEVLLEFDGRYGMFQTVPKHDEVEDKNFPTSLHAAMQLFCQKEMITQARACKTAVDAFLGFLEKGPGTNSVSMGTACVCWYVYSTISLCNGPSSCFDSVLV